MNCENLETITDRVRYCIKRAGGAPKLSTLSGVNKRTIDGYASGRSTPRVEPLLAISEGLNINFLWLASGQGPIEGKMIENIQYTDAVDLNEDVLIAVIQGAEEWYDSHNHEMNISAEDRARVIRALYRLTAKNLNSLNKFDKEKIIKDTKTALSIHLEMIT